MANGPMRLSHTGGQSNRVWIIVAVVMVVALLGWLATSSRSGSGMEDAAVDVNAPEVVALDNIAQNGYLFIGETVKVEEVGVSSRLGDYAFWALTSQSMPFLVKLDREIVDGGFTFEDGDIVTMVGVLRKLTPEVLDGWEAEGVFQSSDDRMVAEFATEYFEVTEVSLVGSSSSEDEGN